MALELVKKLPKDGAFCPTLPALVENIVVPLLDGSGGARTPERSLSTLRNQLAHGGGMTQAVASRMLAAWESRLRAFAIALAPLAEVALVVRAAPGELGVIAGPSPKPRPWSASSPAIREHIEALLPRGDEVVAVRGDRCLQVWPLGAFGLPVPADPDAPLAREATLLVYVRRGEVRLQFTAIGSEEAAVSQGDDAALTRFLDLFCVDAPSEAAKARGFTVPGFEAEVLKEAAKLVGRTIEFDAVRQALDETEAGVLWLAGAAGIGKSCLMARVASDLLDEPPEGVLVLPYRFKAGDPRCSRENFLRYALERLPRLKSDDQEEKKDVSAKALLHNLGKRLTAMDSGRVLFILDGLDEITERDQTFATDVVLTLAEKGGTWLCAGRPEGRLPEAFAKAQVIFPDGLPAMGEGDVRTMLLERIGSHRFTLLKGDRDEGERVFNPFIARVVDAAKGLPLYVEFLIRDILGNRFRALDAGEKLPPSLEAYFEELLRACGIGVVEGLKPHLVATLAVAREPLSPAALSDILARGRGLVDEDDAQPFVLRALAAVGSMVKRTPTQDGEDGFTLYHHALRQHLETSPNAKGLLTLAKSRICVLAVEPVAGARPTATYLHRWGVTHLLEANRHDEAVGLLTNFARLMTRLQVLGDPRGVASLEADWLVVSAAKTVDSGVSLWRNFFRERAHILRRGNEVWPSYKILLQLAVEHADQSPITAAADSWLERVCDWVCLRTRNRPEEAAKAWGSVVLDGHRGAVNGALVLPDHRILSWSDDGTLRLWDQAFGTQLAVFEGHTREVTGAFTLADGRIISWSKKDGDVRIWHGNSGTPLGVLEPHSRRTSSAKLPFIEGAQVSDDGRILSWGHDGTLRVSEIATGQLLVVMNEDTDWVNSAQWLPDGRIISNAMGSILTLWDSRTGKRLTLLEGHTLGVEGVQVIPGRGILSWGLDGTIRLWDLVTGTPLVVLKGHSMAVRGVLAVSNNRILSWSYDTTLRLWDGASGATLAILKGHADRVAGAQLLPDGRILSWSDDCTLRIWHGMTGAALLELKGHTGEVNGAGILADGRIYSWSWDRTLRIWDSTSGTQVGLLDGHFDGVTGAALLPDDRILSWSVDGMLHIWDSSGDVLETFVRHTRSVNGLRAIPDHRVMSWSYDGNLAIWDEATGLPIHILQGHSEQVFNAFALPQGNILSRAGDSTMRLWNGTSGEPLATLRRPVERMLGFEVLPDGRILSMSWKRLHLWDGQDGKLLAVLEGHTDRIQGASVLPDCRVLSWSDDKTLRLWDAASGAALLILSGHDNAVTGATVLADGRILSWSKDGTLRLWDGATGMQLMLFRGHQGFVTGAEVMRDGMILSWSDDGTLRIWDATTGTQISTFGANHGEGDLIGMLLGDVSAIRGAVSLSSGHILFWSSSGELCLWDGSTDCGVARPVAGTNLLGGVKKLPSGEFIASFEDRTIRTLDRRTGAIQFVLKGATGRETNDVRVFEDGRVVEWASESGRLCVWRLPQGRDMQLPQDLSPETVWESDSPLRAACLSDCHYLWVGSASGRVLSLEARPRD